MSSFSFKSAGKTVEEKNIQATQVTAVTPPPIGIVTPLMLGSGSLLAMHSYILDQITDNFRNLLLTNRGERLAFSNFGADLRKLTTEFVSTDDFDAAAMQSIKKAVADWMPFINLIGFSSKTNHTENKETGIREITVTYSVQGFEDVVRKLLVTLYVI